MLLTQCPVCKDTLVRGADIVAAPCGHTYHEYCLLEWLKSKSNCPQCRKICPSNRVKKLYFDFVEEESFSNGGEVEVRIDRLRSSLETTRSKLSHVESLLSSSETACAAAVDRMEKAQASARETERNFQKEQTKNSQLRVELRQNSELLQQMMLEKVEVQELRLEMNAMKDIEKLLKGSTNEANELIRVFEDQAESDSPQVAIRHLAKLVSVLRVELDSLKSEKRILRKDRHRLDKELAHVRRQLASETSAVVSVKEALDQEKAHVAWLERERDSLKTKISQLASCIRSPTTDAISSLARRLAFESPMVQSSPAAELKKSDHKNLSTLDLFESNDESSTPLRDRVSFDSNFFETPSPAPQSSTSNPREANPFALKRRSSSAAEGDQNTPEEGKMSSAKVAPRHFNILRSHLLNCGQEKKVSKSADYDGLGSRQTGTVFISPPPFVRSVSNARNKSKVKTKSKKTNHVKGPTLEKFMKIKLV